MAKIIPLMEQKVEVITDADFNDYFEWENTKYKEKAITAPANVKQAVFDYSNRVVDLETQLARNWGIPEYHNMDRITFLSNHSHNIQFGKQPDPRLDGDPLIDGENPFISEEELAKEIKSIKDISNIIAQNTVKSDPVLRWGDEMYNRKDTLLSNVILPTHAIISITQNKFTLLNSTKPNIFKWKYEWKSVVLTGFGLGDGVKGVKAMAGRVNEYLYGPTAIEIVNPSLLDGTQLAAQLVAQLVAQPDAQPDAQLDAQPDNTPFLNPDQQVKKEVRHKTKNVLLGKSSPAVSKLSVEENAYNTEMKKQFKDFNDNNEIDAAIYFCASVVFTFPELLNDFFLHRRSVLCNCIFNSSDLDILQSSIKSGFVEYSKNQADAIRKIGLCVYLIAINYYGGTMEAYKALKIPRIVTGSLTKKQNSELEHMKMIASTEIDIRETASFFLRAVNCIGLIFIDLSIYARLTLAFNKTPTEIFTIGHVLGLTSKYSHFIPFRSISITRNKDSIQYSNDIEDFKHIELEDLTIAENKLRDTTKENIVFCNEIIKGGIMISHRKNKK